MVARADEDVLRLDVAVDQPGLVRGVERVGDRASGSAASGATSSSRAMISSLRFGPAHEPHGDEQPLVDLAGLVAP